MPGAVKPAGRWILMVRGESDGGSVTTEAAGMPPGFAPDSGGFSLMGGTGAGLAAGVDSLRLMEVGTGAAGFMLPG
ncbi:MAG: hypothetical protein A2340_09065 [Lentisphaerae bacterium RIFOXYB12_FULL_60_10]|nr:MAG: hypothetical protein A2269_04760 [Lentisphaerae bacterium RIFOXYA12_FULL_60_10]OGV86483.1 MAG: hypothetical protein A2340_09065 [Lentisphaerae bacterium RIFOXYB12_FULL_60_10]